MNRNFSKELAEDIWTGLPSFWNDGSTAGRSASSEIQFNQDCSPPNPEDCLNLQSGRIRSRHADEPAFVPWNLSLSSEKLGLLSLVAKNTHHAVIVTDAEGRVQWVNHGFTKLTGYSRREMIGKRPGAMLRGAKSDSATVIKIDKAVAEGSYLRTEVYNYKKNGEGYWSSMEILPVVGSDSAIEGFIAIQMDVSRQKATIDLLNRREKQARLRADIGAILANSKKALWKTLQECADAMEEQIDAALVGIWTGKSVGQILERKASGGSMLHKSGGVEGDLFHFLYTKSMLVSIAESETHFVIEDISSHPWLIDREKALNANLSSFIGCPLVLDNIRLGVLAMYFEQPLTTDLIEAVNSIADIIAQRLKREKAEEELRHAHFVMEMRVAERTVELVKTVDMMKFEVCERKRAEEKLGETHDFLRTIIDSLPNIIYVKDRTGKYVLVNEPFAQLFDIKTDDAIGKTAGDFVSEDIRKKLNTEDEKIFEGSEEKFSSEEKMIDAFGKDHWIQTIKRPLFETDGKPRYILGIINDLTERKILETQLQQSQKLESIGQLAAGIAHEINTPTQFVSDNTHFLREVFDELNPVLQEYKLLLAQAEEGIINPELVNRIKEAIESSDLEYLCEEAPKALDQTFEGVSRIALIVKSMKDFAHPGTGVKQSVDLNRAIESTLTVARNEYKYVADLETEFDAELPPVPCQLGEINQVILNMVINAAHAIAEVTGESPEHKGSIRVSTKNIDDQWAEIRIKDTGAGIPAEIHTRIFDPFFTTKEVGTGTGQGLAISHSVIVDKHDGQITFNSAPGNGTEFIIRLPIFAG